jgi:hypothetical protein
MLSDYTYTFACYNQLYYTKKFIESLDAAEVDFSCIVAVDNGSTGTVGDTWLHHYGRTTQKALKLEKKMNERDSLGNRSLMKLYMGQTWWGRKRARFERSRHRDSAVAHELNVYGQTVHGLNRQTGQMWEWV